MAERRSPTFPPVTIADNNWWVHLIDYSDPIDANKDKRIQFSEFLSQIIASNDGFVQVDGYYDTPLNITAFNVGINTIEHAEGTLFNGTPIAFKSGSGDLDNSIVQDKTYYIISSGEDVFQITEDYGIGTPVNLTGGGTAGAVFYDLNSAIVKPTYSLGVGIPQAITYPIDSKLEINTASSWPKNAGVEDNLFYDFVNNTFLENAIINQVHIFRLIVEFNSVVTRSSLQVEVRNSSLGTIFKSGKSIARSHSTDFFCYNLITIATLDTTEGYQLLLSSNLGLDVTIESIARVSLYKAQ